MPPIRLKLRDLPRVPDGLGDDNNNNYNNNNVNNNRVGAPQRSSAGIAVGAGIAARTTEHLSDAWRVWPATTAAAVHSTVKGWFTRMDAALLALPKGLGPAASSLVRLLSLVIAASIVTSIIARTSSHLLKLPSRASKAVGEPSSYTPGRHAWVAAPSRWDPHYCGVCSEAIAWNSDSGVRCQICGSHAHMSCSKRAHKEGLGCKALCSADVELSHKRLYHPLEEDEDQDDDACVVSLEPEDKPPPVMRHQWMRGSIDDSQPCSGCGGSCAGSGATGQHGFSCAWCKLQVHEGCVSRVSQSECSLGRHRRLILPPTAVLKDQPRRRRGLIRDAVSKVRRVLPGNRDDECDPPPCVDPNDAAAVAAATAEAEAAAAAGEGGGARGQGTSSSGGSEQQGSSFVEAVREAAAALDVAAAKEVGSRIAEKVRDAGEKVRDARLDVAAGLDVAGDSAKEGGRRLAEKVLDAMPIELEDEVWEEALRGESDQDIRGNDVDPAAAAAGAGAAAGIDRVWEAALSSSTTTDAAAETTEDDSIAAGADGNEGDEGATTVEAFVVKGEEPSRAGGEERSPSLPAAVGDGARAASEDDRPAPPAAAAGGIGNGDRCRGDGDDDELGGSGGVWKSRGGGEGGDEEVGVRAIRDVGSSPGGDTLLLSPGEVLGDYGDGKAQGKEGPVPERTQETIVSEYVSMAGGALRSPSSSSADAGSGSSSARTAAGKAGAGRSDRGILGLREPSAQAKGDRAAEGGVPSNSTGVVAEAGGGGNQQSEYQEVSGVGVAGWAKEESGGGADCDKQQEGQEGEQEEEEKKKEEKEEEGEEEEETEWVVKMQELYAKFQTSGEGEEATKTVTYSRKTRSVTLTICEESIPDDSCPLLVFVNSKSGGKQGGMLLRRFRALLNPLQVSDLSQEDPLEVLSRFRNVPNLRLLACGGDGTVAWLLQSVDSVTWKVKRPPLAILPLGTGNDLARVLGWGGGYVGEDLEPLLDTIQNAQQVTMLDRWSVAVVTTGKGGFRKAQKDRQLIMNNYLGIGVDGQVALDFHKMREARPVLFFNRLFNKALYAQLGVRSALVRACHDLPSRMELRCDGQLVQLPETTASIIACNINSYGGGSKLWAVEERNRRAWAGRTSNHPLSYPQAQQQQKTMWGFDTSGLVNPGGSLPSGVSGGAAGEDSRPLTSAAGEVTGLPGLRTGLVGADARADGTGPGVIPPKGVATQWGSDDAGELEGAGSWSGSESWSDGEDSQSSDGDEGRWENPRDSRGSSSMKRESKTSFHDGVLEVVAVEGVLHLGQIQLGLSRALAVAQCREMQVKTTATLPMQVDGEPWKQPPSEITVKLHNQARASCLPATTTERAVASVLNDVSSAVHCAEQDLIINERQARTLLSRIRRSVRLPE
ncbi:unnamed protein product [Pylaiella littoralis]